MRRVQGCVRAGDAKAVNRKIFCFPSSQLNSARLAIARSTSTRSSVNVNMSSLFPLHHPSLSTQPSTPSPAVPPSSPLLALPMVDPAAILAIVRPIDTASTLVCNEIDKALELEHEARPALKDLRKGVENLKPSLMTFKVLLNAIRVDAGFTFVQVLYVMW